MSTKNNEMAAILKRLSYWLKPHIPAMILGGLLGLGMNAASIYVSVLQQDVLDTMGAGKIPTLFHVLFSGGLIIVASVVVGSIGGVVKGYMGVKIPRDFRLQTFDHVNHLPMARVDRMHSGDLVSRASKDASKATGSLAGSIFSAFDIVTLMVGAFVYLARINLLATVVAACAGPVIFLSGRFFDKGIRKRGEEIQRNEADLRKFLQEDIQGMAVVASYGLENVMTEEFTKLRKDSLSLNLAQSLAWNLQYQSGSAANELATLFCTMVIAQQAILGNLTPGAVLAFVILINRVTWPVVNLSRVWGGVHELIGSAKRVFEILDMEAEPSEAKGLSAVPNPSAPVLELTNVSFSYETRADVLKNISLKIAKGQMIAVVGPSGGGKSTLAKLSLGLYAPTEGSVRVAGYNTATKLREARSLISYVPQNPHVFAATVRENVLGGEETASEKEMGDAIRAAGLDGVMADLPNGLDTSIGERGLNLSGGQRQRLALARAILRRGKLVVLDEATSALDNETEAMIQESIQKLKKDAGILVIAHRLTTIMGADRIVVLEDGRISEEGTHDQLLELDGSYARLWRLSQKEADDGDGSQGNESERCAGSVGVMAG